MTTTTIKAGTLVSATERRIADMRIVDGRVDAVGELENVGSIVDAAGLFVLPGMVDTHTHLMDPGDPTREDFPSGTRAAAARGVTCIVEHTHSHPIRDTTDFQEKRHHLEGRSNVDYGLAAHVWPGRIDEIQPLIDAGIAFFKIFTCTTHGVPGLSSSAMADALGAIAAAGGTCLIHNEDEQMTADAEKRLKEAGRKDPGLLIEWRNRAAELAAVSNTAAIALASGARVTMAHVSNPVVLDVIDAFRGLGADLAAEACPQYFALEENEVREHGALRKFTPPARIRTDSERTAMWEAVAMDRFSHFSTDHAPSTLGQKTAGDFWEVHFGLPGLDTTLPFLLDAAFQGLLTLEQVVRLYSTAPAARYSLPKGRLDPGFDADLVLVDPAGSWTVDDEMIISKAGWSPFSGTTFNGSIVATYLRGQLVADGGTPLDARTGRLIRPQTGVSRPRRRS